MVLDTLSNEFQANTASLETKKSKFESLQNIQIPQNPTSLLPYSGVPPLKMKYQMVLKVTAYSCMVTLFRFLSISPRLLDGFFILVAQMKATVAYVTNPKEFLLFID